LVRVEILKEIVRKNGLVTREYIIKEINRTTCVYENVSHGEFGRRYMEKLIYYKILGSV